jgi:hypothetical protein
MSDAADRLHELADEVGEDGLEDTANALHGFARELATALKRAEDTHRIADEYRAHWKASEQTANGNELAYITLKQRMVELGLEEIEPGVWRNKAKESAEMDARAKQAEIDRLMLEFCPDEMTPEQMKDWAEHQQMEEDSATDAALAKQKEQ